MGGQRNGMNPGGLFGGLIELSLDDTQTQKEPNKMQSEADQMKTLTAGLVEASIIPQETADKMTAYVEEKTK